MIKQIPGRSIFLDDETIFAELICDTISELAEVTTIDGNTLAFGSIAIAVKDDKLCIYSSDSKWYCEGKEVTGE